MSEEEVEAFPGWESIGQVARGWVKPTCGCDPEKRVTCFKHKLKSIQFNGTGKSRKTLREEQLAKDLPAYQRLRMNGLQPLGTKGCARLEKHANSQTEIEMGHLVDKKLLPKVEEGMAIAREIEWKPLNTEGESGAAVREAKDRRLKGV